MKRGIENKKMDTAAKLSSERQNDAAAVQTAEIPENYCRSPELRKIKESAADIKYISDSTCRSYKHRGGSNNGTRHMIPQNEGKFPEPDKLAKSSKYTKYVV
jgi:hypothetical protein